MSAPLHGWLARARAVIAIACAAYALLACAGARTSDEAGDDLRWLRQRSMLLSGERLAAELSGQGLQWRRPYALPRPRALLERASVWLALYPDAWIREAETSLLGSLADPALLDGIRSLGIEALHTGPLKLAGSVSERRYQPSIDGQFDRIELSIAPKYGSADAYRAFVAAAAARGISVIGDIVPGHTGLGPDFRLAERGVPGFPGIYTMVEIAAEDWPLLPDVPAGRDAANLSREQAALLGERGYIPGALEIVVFARPGIKQSNWSATRALRGWDGRERRWVYLHFFKEGQPSLNWLDPSFGAQRLIGGDALHSLQVLGATALRLDATMFLGAERRPDGRPGWVKGFPLSTGVGETLAMLIRKFGGYSFQELNTSLDALAEAMQFGPELGYDFVTRPAYLYALITGDAGPLRVLMREALEHGVRPGRLVHALQNHDELMLEAVHFAVKGDTRFRWEGGEASGEALYRRVADEVLARTTGSAAPYNERFAMSPGVCSTLAGLAAASIGVASLEQIEPEQIDRIRRMHLAAAAFNALQPGVFAVSAWDLVGALPIARESVRERLADDDCRWINRGGVDLVGAHPDLRASREGLPKAHALYGALPAQLQDPESFAYRLRELLAVREELGIALGRVRAVLPVDAAGLLVLRNELATGAGADDAVEQVTAVNFGQERAALRIEVAAGAKPRLRYSTRRGALDEPLALPRSGLALALEPLEAVALTWEQGPASSRPVAP